MWFLHVVAVPGGAGWQHGLALWLTVLAIGGLFAYLAGEAKDQDALLADLALATAGGLLLNLAVAPWGQDPLAVVFGLRLFWTALGAMLLLMLAHDAVHLLADGLSPEAKRWLVISDRGGFILLFSWLSGWPSEPALVEATYDGRLGIKLMPESLHYQVHVGPLAGARAIVLLPGITAASRGSSLTIAGRPGTEAAAALRSPVTLAGIEPPEAADLLRARIERLNECRQG